MALASFSPPIAATSIADGLPRVVIGVHEDSTGQLMFIAIGTDGKPERIEPWEFTFDFRWNGSDWVDPGDLDDDDEA
jgi:hypothetical protein